MTRTLSFFLLALLLASSTQDAGAGQAGETRKVPYDKETIVDDKTRAESARAAAMDGSASAQYNLALMYRKGKGVRQDDKRAVMWYEKSAAQGHAKAQANLGFMYETGTGVAKDGRKAIELYRKAAAQGVPVAQFNMGVHYTKGDSLPQDDVRAYAWFSVAVENGFADALEHRENVAKRLTAAQKAEGKKLARDFAVTAKRETRR